SAVNYTGLRARQGEREAGLMHLRGLLGTLAPVALAGAPLAGPQAAQAGGGGGLHARPVPPAGAGHPGQSRGLPAVSVVNAGSYPESIRLSVRHVAKGSSRAVPPSWIQFGAPVVELAPKHATRISIELVVPGDAKPGAYLSDIVATGTSA